MNKLEKDFYPEQNDPNIQEKFLKRNFIIIEFPKEIN